MVVDMDLDEVLANLPGLALWDIEGMKVSHKHVWLVIQALRHYLRNLGYTMDFGIKPVAATRDPSRVEIKVQNELVKRMINCRFLIDVDKDSDAPGGVVPKDLADFEILRIIDLWKMTLDSSNRKGVLVLIANDWRFAETISVIKEDPAFHVIWIHPVVQCSSYLLEIEWTHKIDWYSIRKNFQKHLGGPGLGGPGLGGPGLGGPGQGGPGQGGPGQGGPGQGGPGQGGPGQGGPGQGGPARPFYPPNIGRRPPDGFKYAYLPKQRCFTVSTGDKEFEELKLEEEQKEMFYHTERCGTASLIEKKDAVITKLEATAAERKLNIENLSSQLEKLQSELTKEDEVKDLVSIQEKLENFEKLVSSEQEDKEVLSTAETKRTEAKKQYDLMLESKQLELSQRNDQAINEIRMKYDVEKQEIIISEKDKVEKIIKELSTKYDKELSDCKEESKRQLLTIQEEHSSLILSIRKEHESKELNLKAKYDQELRQNQIQAENELKERITALKSEHDAQLKAFKCQYEDDCKKLQEELDLQRKKGERQRALVQLHWKVMSDNPPEEQEVNSNKNYSISKDSRLGGSKRSEHIRVRADNDDEQDSPFVKAKETAVSKSAGSLLSIPNPKHHSRVTHRECEDETNNGRVTKRRKTRNTAMFEEPQRRRTRVTPKLTPHSVAKGAGMTGHHRSANIGDLFSEGSLNPYADDLCI